VDECKPLIVGSRHRLDERQHSVAVLGGGAAAVGVPGSLPARASSAGAAASAGSPSGSSSGGHGAANPARISLELAPLVGRCRLTVSNPR
jgi:hypothetical protein